MILRKASPSGFLPQIGPSSDRSREFPDTSGSIVADGSRQIGGPFLFRNGVGIHQLSLWFRLCKRFIVIIFTKFWWVNWIHAFFHCQNKSYMSLRVSRSLTRFWLMRRPVTSKTICPTVEYSAGEECRRGSWCKWSCTAKIQNNVGWMVGKVQWEFAAIHAACPVPHHSAVAQGESVTLEHNSSDSQGHVFLHSTILRQKVLIERSFSFSPLIFTFIFVRLVFFVWTFFLMKSATITFRKIVPTLRKDFLAFLIFGPPTQHCFLRTTNHCLVLRWSALLFLLLTWRRWKLSGLPSMLVVVPCPKTRSFITNITLCTSCFVNGPQSVLVVFRVVFSDEGSVHVAAMSAHAERRIQHSAFSACRTIQQKKVELCQKCML